MRIPHQRAKSATARGKGKKRAEVAAASMGVGVQPYTPMELLSSRDAHLKAMAVSLEAANSVLPSSLCTDPILPLVVTLAIFRATLDSLCIVPYHMVQVTEVGDYLAEWLATMATLLDKSTPTVAALFDAIPSGKGGRQRGPGKTLFFDITHRLTQRVPLTKMVELDGDICLYFTILMVASLVWVGETLVMLEGTWIMMITREAYDNMLLKEASHNYNNYGLVSR